MVASAAIGKARLPSRSYSSVSNQPIVTKNHTTAPKRPNLATFRWVNHRVRVTIHSRARARRSPAGRTSSPTASAQETTNASVTSARSRAIIAAAFGGASDTAAVGGASDTGTPEGAYHQDR